MNKEVEILHRASHDGIYAQSVWISWPFGIAKGGCGGYVLYVIDFDLVGRSHYVVAIRRVCILVYNVLPANVVGQVVHFFSAASTC